MQKIIGTAIILTSVILVTRIKNGLKMNKGVWYAMGMALCYGLAIVVDTYNVRNYDAVSYSATINLIIAFILLLLFPSTLKQLDYFVKSSFLKKMLPLVAVFSIQSIAFCLALANGGNASQIGPINQAQVIITVLLAVIFLNERDYLFRKLKAAIFVSIGVILLK